MSDPDDYDADLDDEVDLFESDFLDVDPLLARLGRLQKRLARREPDYKVALQAYNAALRAAHDQLSLAAGEYLRIWDVVFDLRMAITLEMDRRAEEQAENEPGWDETEAGRKYDRWSGAWQGFEDAMEKGRLGNPFEVAIRQTPLSAMIAALPLRPEDVELPVADRPIDPAIASSVRESWRRIDAWLARHAPALAARMPPGASPEKIAETEAALGMELPEAVRASYLIHDGSDRMGIFPSGDYLSLDGMLIQHRCWKELIEEGTFEGMGCRPIGLIQQVHFHPGWVPLTNDGAGDHTLIDLAPGEGGGIGQLVDFSHEGGPERVAATGLAEYLAYLADGLEAGAATIDGGKYVEWNKEQHTPRSGYILPRSAPKPAAVDEPARRRFEFKEGSSSKFWEISHRGRDMTTRYGKIGSKGNSTTKTFETAEQAGIAVGKIIARKLAEGYVERISP